jgi:predicted O-linked N-acetylglucosamine transferase (SPINDLY family)
MMDFAAFARDMEAAYRAMWRKWCAQRPAAG